MKHLHLALAMAILVMWTPAALGQFKVTSPDGKRLATAKDKVITLTEVETQRTILRIFGHTAEITGLSFSRDGKLLASIDESHTLKMYDTTAGRELWGVKANFGGRLSFSQDGSTLNVESGHKIKKFNVETGAEVH